MGFDPGLIDWDVGIRLLGSGCPGTGIWVRGPGFGCPGIGIWVSGDCMEGIGEPWMPLEILGDAQKPGL